MQRAAGFALLVMVLGSCGDGGDGFGTPAVERPAAPPAEAQNLTLEEAGLIAAGELAAIYGAEADALPVHVEAEIAELGGQRVWQLDMRVDVTLGDSRLEREWRMWVGTDADGSPAVLRAQEQS